MAASARFDVPPEMRAFAEKSVEQARQAFDGFISAAHQAMSAFEGQAETARKGAKDVTEKAMTFAERNITSAFEFAQELMRARDIQDVLRLQADYIKRQMQALTEQARELGETTSKAAKDATAPKRWRLPCFEAGGPEKGWYDRHLIVRRNICVALHQKQEYILPHQTAVAFPMSGRRPRACCLQSMDRPWARIRAMPDQSPSEGSIYDRGHRNDHVQVQIKGGPAGRVRNAEIRTPEF